MICPICGTQQRAADRCVQCHTPISKEKHQEDLEDVLSDTDSILEESLTTVSPPTESLLGAGKQHKAQASAGAGPTHASYPSVSSKGSQVPKSAGAASPGGGKQSPRILVATTQRIEGKRIAKYFGLIHVNTVVDLSDLSISPTGIEYQTQFKRGTMEAVKRLKAEAAAIGANAVVATLFSFNRIDTQVILLSATGTAVLLETPKAA